MINILLDTNMLIYREDNRIIEKEIAELTRNLYDSEDFKIVIHPKSIEEAYKNQNKEQRDIFLSKLSTYPQIDKPPKPTIEFVNSVGSNSDNDIIDNELLYAIKQHCAEYLITNDIKLKNKSKKIQLQEKVLSIKEALEQFKKEEVHEIETPVFISYESLRRIRIEDEFFESLIKDYKGFGTWFEGKQKADKKAYVTKEDDKITSFLMLKEEGKYENYKEFNEPLEPANRLKVATLKVSDTGKKIGEAFIKIMIKEALDKKVDEIYVTVFPRHKGLIYLLEEYGFFKKTYKITEHSNGDKEKELIFIKNMRDKTQFPYVVLNNKKSIILPVIPEFHKLLFQEAEENMQISFDDYKGEIVSANAIKKSFITNGPLKSYNPGDVLFFYASEDKRAITAVGVVDRMFTNFDKIEDAKSLIKRRTAYNEMQLNNVLRTSSKVIMFRHFVTLNNPITYSTLMEKGIIKGAIQSPMQVETESLIKVLQMSESDIKMFNIN